MNELNALQEDLQTESERRANLPERQKQIFLHWDNIYYHILSIVNLTIEERQELEQNNISND